MPSEPQARAVWLTPARRYMPWIVRTWMSSPEWRAGHDRDLGRGQLERLDPAGLEQGEQPERLDARAEGDHAVRVAEQAHDPAGRIDLDHVAAVDALDDPVARLADEDRRGAAASRARDGRAAVERERAAVDRVIVTWVDRSSGTGSEGEDTAPWPAAGWVQPGSWPRTRCYDANRPTTAPEEAR